MSLKEDMLDIKNEVNEIKEKSFAYELVKTQQKLHDKQNRRNFIIIFVLIIALIIETCYLFYLKDDIGTIETTTEETYDMSTEDGNNNYIGGDNNGYIENN
jgi:hypothetical protein